MGTDTDTRKGWTPLKASPGHYWQRGEFIASSDDPLGITGWLLYKNGDRLAEFVSWGEVERLADRRRPKRIGG